MTMLRSSTLLAVASVALVVLIDLATGQGPPIFTSYLQTQPDFRGPHGPPAPGALRPNAFAQGPANFEPVNREEYQKAVELEKKEAKEGKKDKKFEKGDEKEYKKLLHEGQGDKYNDKYADETTPKPGVLSSFSNSMSGAWKSISTLGRDKRGADEAKGNTTAAPEARSSSKTESLAHSAAPAERTTDGYEHLQHKNQGYVYFKVPKYLVCNY